MLTEVKRLAQGHTAAEWQGWDLSPCVYWVVFLLQYDALTVMDYRGQERIRKMGPISARPPNVFWVHVHFTDGLS